VKVLQMPIYKRSSEIESVDSRWRATNIGRFDIRLAPENEGLCQAFIRCDEPMSLGVREITAMVRVEHLEEDLRLLAGELARIIDVCSECVSKDGGCGVSE
jgi:hypothetical protein